MPSYEIQLTYYWLTYYSLFTTAYTAILLLTIQVIEVDNLSGRLVASIASVNTWAVLGFRMS